MLADKSIELLIQEINSASPAPGGGSVSALVGALGSSLVGMFAALSITKKKFKEANTQEQNAYTDKITKVEVAIKDMLFYMEEDTRVYNAVMQAYKLPKNDEHEIAMRQSTINKAMVLAINSPLDIMRSGVKILNEVDDMLELGNKNAISDYIVGILLLHSAIEGAHYNVMINLSSFSNDEAQAYQNQMLTLMQDATRLKHHLIEKAQAYL